ncbi:MAG: class I SAM-dependent methyltransferase [Erythrobacter sp.]|uniref:class I SAM-dependent methyltransferase n=1 Tax=Erythrobacter sp. TaxID=1042 RepID=UPI003A844543
MRPPWEVEPEKFADKFWIVAKSDYLEEWRNWFTKLGEAQQAEYKAAHSPPEACGGMFYDTFGVPRYDPVAYADSHRDEEGLLPPPWVYAPDIPRGSIGWRMGHGEDYWHVFFDWLRSLPPEDQERVKAKYPEPAPETVRKGLPWQGIYEAHLNPQEGQARAFFGRMKFDERRYADFLRDRFPEFWARFGGMPNVAGKRVIDFGCGRGGMVQRMMEAGADSALGIELNQSYVDFANWKVASQWDGRVRFACQDIREMNVEPADIVTSVDVMEHVMDLSETLAKVVDACKPGGELFIGFAPLWHSPFGHHRLMETRIPWAHLPRGNRAFLDRLVDDDGNSPEKIQELGFSGATPADFRAALKGLPVEIVSARRNVASHPLKALALKAMLIPSIIPALEKYVTVGIYWHLRRKK